MKQYHTLVWLLLLLGIAACKPKNSSSVDQTPTTFTKSNAQYQYYVSAYTSGMISATSPIRVRFANDVIPLDKVGSTAPEDILTIEPKIAGSFVWEDLQTLRFNPDEWLPQGQFYKVTADLKKIYPDIKKELAVLNFDFKVRQQNFEVDIRGLREQSLTDLSQMRLIGTVLTTDAALPRQVEQMLTIKQDGNSDFRVNWDHSSSHKTHHFEIEGIKSFEEGSKLLLNWNGKSIGVERMVTSDTVQVPSSEFKLMNVKVIQDANEQDPYILAQFSLPLQQVQDLNGLVSIEDYRNTDYNGRSNFRNVIDGNELRVYPLNTVEGDRKVRISAGIRSINKTAIPEPIEWDVSFDAKKPAVRLVGNGVIIPKTDGLYFPFEAIKLRGVEVEIFKVYEDNVLQFLQAQKMDETYSMHYVGRIVAQKHVSLEGLNPKSNKNGWVRYGLKLDDFVKEEEGAIYQVRLAFSKKDALCDCVTDEEIELTDVDNGPKRDEDGELISIYGSDSYYDDYYYYYDDYDRSKRDNPCFKEYYSKRRFKKRNMLGSNIGIIAKRGRDKELFVVATDLLTAAPLPNATVEVYDKVLQPMAKLSSNSEGIVRTKTDYRPEFVVVSHKKQKGYLRIRDGEALSLSTFETSGTSDYKGIKGKMYGERGVWRPGDSLYLTFVLEDKLGEFPDDHPVTFELYDTRGNLHQKKTTNRHVHGMYDFRTKTSSSAGTGTWSAQVHVGGSTFHKSIRIETVKPNRLKIVVDMGKERLLASDSDLSGDLEVKWLHGAPASDLEAQIDVKLTPEPTKFKGYDNYEFDDPARNKSYYASPMTIFDGKVDKDGKAKIGGVLELAKQPSGFMRAGFTTRVSEKSGDVSSDNFSMSYSPYASYVGIKSPKGIYDKSLDLNVSNDLAVVVLDEDGKPLANKKVLIGVYKVNWNWWWDHDEITNFNSSSHLGALETKLVTTNAKGEAIWKFTPKEWGRYLIRVADEASGHCSGNIFHAGSPWNDDNFNDKQAATMLAFSANKESYTVGEEVVLEIPAGDAGRALLTLENGFRVVDHKWVPIQTEDGVQKISFKAKEGMAPTIYAHVTLLQPHQQVQNDLPIRSYGVIPIKIIDPKTKLEPVLDMADVLEPNTSVKIKVTEKNNRPMSYTIAMVDEGLLDLTRFQTPELWEHFYQKEALGVRTWDMYNYVLGAQQLDQILAIGGGAGLSDDGKKANRFKPVVRFAGPFHLEAGKKAAHKLEMPNYVGSVRTMIVAAEAGAYGKTDKATPVRKPLMVLGTLPRVLSPTEEVKLPVTVFAMEKHVKDVTVRIECNDLLKLQGSASKMISFDRLGDAIVNFDLKVADKLGIAKVKIFAESGKEKAMYEVELDVRNPNPYTNKVHQLVIDGGKEWNVDVEPVGMVGTNEARLEISNIPPIDLAKRLEYLVRYPYGCIEQTTSSVFPQLYVGNLMKLDATMEKDIEQNVKAALKRLYEFQTGLGGFAYWPGGAESSDWGTNYAGHFMLEAKAKGYAVPKDLLNNWKRYQKTLAKNWRPKVTVSNSNSNTLVVPVPYNYSYPQDALMQAYRLYTLALAKSPDLGAMNKMRNAKGLPNKAKWRLAAAYALVGKKEVAKDLTRKLSTTVSAYTERSYTYGSDLRDEAMILETLTLLGQRKKGANLIKRMSDRLSSSRWFATQTIAYSLMSIAKFVGGEKLQESVPFAYQIGAGGLKNAALKDVPMAQYAINVDDAKQRKIKVKNKAKTPLFASVIMSGQPPLNDTKADASNIELNVVYQTLDGELLDPSKLEQGTNFVALVTVNHMGTDGNYDEMALHQVFPAGWEIINTRMNEAFDDEGSSRMDYQNILDDRIYTYFDLRMGEVNVYKFFLNAAYQGKFYMPNVSCGAMYDNSIYANTAGKWVEVAAPKSAL